LNTFAHPIGYAGGSVPTEILDEVRAEFAVLLGL
jgi:hypothetical protein